MEFADKIATDIDAAFAWAPDWFTTLVVLAAALLGAWLLHRLVFRLLSEAVRERDLFWRSVVSRSQGLVQVALLVIAAGFAGYIAPIGPSYREGAEHLVMAGLIVLIALGARTTLNIWMTLHLRRYKLDVEDNLLARQHVTQIKILRRIADVLIAVLGIGAVLMTFESVRHYGVSLLASAGAAGLVAGLALQPLLKNLFAGIQLALTQPIRLDDALIVEGEWGNVEEITSTYVVIRIWDWRRLVVPLSYFIEQPFQNWTRESATLIGSVLLFLDYRTPMAPLRAKVEEIVRATPLWDRNIINVQVTDSFETTMQVRVLATARTAPLAWDLRCHIREQLISWLQREHPEALPTARLHLESGRGTPDGREPQGGAVLAAAE